MPDLSRFSLGTFSSNGEATFAGAVFGERVIPLAEIGIRGSVLSLLENWEDEFAKIRDGLGAMPDGVPSIPVDELRIHPPVNLPRQILCTGANYRKHVIDLIVDEGGGPPTASMSPEERTLWAAKMMDERAASGKPYIFTKLPSALTGARDPIILAANSPKIDWELELAAVIGKRARHVKRDQALSFVAGYTIANDVTNRSLVFRTDMKAIGTDWLAAKSSPRCTPVGPWLVPASFVENPHSLRLTLKLNGQTMQDDSTADMVFDLARIIEYASSLVELLPGDLLLTGSPAGNGTRYNRFLQPGDVVESSIIGLGSQRNLCVAETSQ